MPAPIVIRNLTPETKKAADPGPDDPLIATKADLRDGSRVSSAPDPDPVDPGTVDWEARLAKTGSGTPDPTFDPETDITYVGAFRIPYFSNGTTSTQAKTAVVFKEPEVSGRNGPNGSLFLGGDGADPGGWVAEIQIPDFSGTLSTEVSEYLSLPETTILQNFVSVLSKAPIQDPEPLAAPVRIPGAMKFVGDTLYMSFYAYYEGNGINESNVLVCDDAKDMENSSYIGLLSRDGMDRGAKYTIDIPTEYQPAFNGNTAFVGIWASVSIIGRSSFGPALYGWNPEAVQATDTHVPATEWAMYGSSTQVEFWDYEAADLNAYYDSQVDGTINDYLNSDPATRISNPDVFPLPDDLSLHPGSGHQTQIQCAFIPPGTDTVVFIGTNSGMKHGGGYKAYTWEFGNTIGTTSGYSPYSAYDVYNVIWTMNINDVANAANPSDPGLIQQSLFDGQRWRFPDTSSRKGSHAVRGAIDSGTFDPSTGRLYLVHSRAPRNEYTEQKIVSVYQVGGGA